MLLSIIRKRAYVVVDRSRLLYLEVHHTISTQSCCYRDRTIIIGPPVRENSSMASSSSSSSSLYDVFLSFRGEDTRKKFVDHLYSALQLRGIYTYKDDEKLPRGEVIGPSLFKGIRESRIVIIVFSKNYVDSSWCLDELAYIMKCKDIIMPIFYDVDPSDVRKQNGEFGKVFKKQKLENVTKAESWSQALKDAGNLAGWEPKHIANGHEAKCIKEIVDTISDKLFSLYLGSDEDDDLVGMNTRVSCLISKLEFSSNGVRMVGIWGVGGGGKTTLASSVHMKIASDFEADCIVDNVREEYGKHNLKKLQKNILKSTLKTSVKVQSVEDGKRKIKERLCHKKVLILLDDVDDLKQLEALAGSHKWFGEGSRIVITTRDEHLLISHRVDEIYHINLLSNDEALRLFNRYAYQKNEPVEGYKPLSKRVVSYAAGLPLALKVLGSFLYERDINEWLSTLDRLEDNPEMKIVETLKISYDGLTHLEQELFLDIACFFRGADKDYAMERLDACGFHPVIGIRVLIEKALITITDGQFPKFDMHDLVQEMGHYIVRGEHPNNPEKHSRVWKTIEIDNMCSVNAIMANYKIEAIVYAGGSSRFPLFVSNMMKLRFLNVHSWDISPEEPIHHSSELRFLRWDGYPGTSIPESFQPTKLVYLHLGGTMQIELWKGYKILPCLKKLALSDAHKLITTPDFSGLPCLERLELRSCRSLESIHPSLGHHRSLDYLYVEYIPKLGMFPTIVRMEKLRHLIVTNCDMLRVFPVIETNMDSLVKLSLDGSGIEVLPSSIGKYCTNLISLSLSTCRDLKRIEGNFYGLKHLRELKIPCHKQFEMISLDLFDDNCCLEKLMLRGDPLQSSYSRWSGFTLGGDLIQSSYSRCSGLSRLPLSLTMLDLMFCGLEDGDIPSNIAELSNLQELHLSGNDFTRLNFSLSPLTRLKYLNLFICKRLVELPKLPPSISILRADYCESLEAIGNVHSNCKWLCQVSLLYGRDVIGADKLLQSMLQGNAIENHFMVLQIQGLEIQRSFTPPVRKGTKYTLELPENWCNDFCGFLICATSMYQVGFVDISMTHAKGMESRPEFSSNDLVDTTSSTRILVVYISFSLLRHTTWWDETSYVISFSNERSSALGVRLIPRKTQNSRMETTTDPSESYYTKYKYAARFHIKHDSKFALKCSVIY